MTAISWKSGVGGDWSLNTNWSPASVPGGADTVTIAVPGAGAYTVVISVAEAAAALTLNSVNASLQVNSTLTMGGLLTLTAGTINLAGVIKNGTLVMNGGSFVPGGGTLDGVRLHGPLILGQSFGPALVVKDGLTLANLAGTAGGTLALIGQFGSVSLAPGVQTLTSQIGNQVSTIDIGNTLGDTIGMQNASGTITTATFSNVIDIVQTGRLATLTASTQAGDSMVNKGTINAGLRNGSFTINGGSFVNQGAITVTNGDTVTINSSNFSNSGAISVSNTGTLNIGQGGTWTSTGVISETDATVNLLGTVSTAEVSAITSRAGGLIDLAGSLSLGGGTLNVGTGTVIKTVLLTGTIANGIVHDPGLGLQFGTNSFPQPTLDGITYDGVLDLSEPSAHLTVRNTFTATGTGGTGPGTINLTGNGANLTMVGSRTLDLATLRIGNASINISNPGTTTAVTFGTGLTIRQGGVGGYGLNSTISGSFQSTDSLLNQGNIFGSLQNGSFTISGVGTFTNAGAIGFSNGDNLTVNASSVINQTSITLGNGVVASFVGGNSFSNPGTIRAAAGDSVSISSPTLTNAGTVLIGGNSTLGISGFTSFANTGSINLQPNATLNIGSASAAWSSTGTITATNATVNLNNIVTQGEIGAITRTGGVIDIVGTLNDTGATLNVGTGSAFGALELTGTIVGGTIHDAGAGLTFVSAQYGATPVLDGVTYQGVVDLSEASAKLSVLDEITLTGTAGTGAGTVNLTGSGSSMLLTGSATLDNATINIGGAPGGYYSQGGATLGSAQTYSGGATLLTLGPKLIVQQAGQSATLQGPTNATDMLINRGTINAGVSGGIFTITGNQFVNLGVINVSGSDVLSIAAASFTNPGTVNVLAGGMLDVGSGGDWISTGKVTDQTGATVLLNGDVTLAEIKSITRSGGAEFIAGRFDNLGGTLAVGSGSPLGSFVLTGTIDNGTVHDAGGGFVLQSGTLDGVTYQGTVDLSTAGASLTVLDAITLTGAAGTGAGTVNLTGAGSQLVLQEPQTLDNATINIGNAAGATLKVVSPFFGGNSWSTTLGSKLVIKQAATSATLAASTGTTDILTNNGAITAAVAGGVFTISGANFVNAGIITVSTGDTMNVTAGSFSNSGTVTITTGGVLNLGTVQQYYYGPVGSWSSTGKLAETGGAINLNEPVTLANLNSITRSGGTVTLGSTADLGGGVLNVGGTSALGALVVTGAIQNGTIHDADPGLVFTTGGSVTTTGTLANVTYLGTFDLSEPRASVALVGPVAFGGTLGTGTTGTILLTGPGSTMTTLGTITLDNAKLSLGGATLTAAPAPEIVSGSNPSSAQLTLGPNLSITHTVSTGGTNGFSQISSTAGFVYGAVPGSVTNQGTITAGLAGGSLAISGGGFTNQGKLAVFGTDAVTVTASTFSNAGVVTVNNASLTIGASSSATSFNNTGTLTVTGGGTLTLGIAGGFGGALTWTNTGTLSETGSTLILNGPVTLANLDSITRTGGTITLAGTADLGGGTLNLGGGTSHLGGSTLTLGPLVLTGAIQNGTINDADPGLILQGLAAKLNNMTYHGTFDMSAAGAVVSVIGGLALAGLGGAGAATILLTGAGSLFNAVGTTTLGNALVDIGGGASLLAVNQGSVSSGGSPQLTLASNLNVVHTGGNATIGGGVSYNSSPANIINQGNIAAMAAGGLFTINGGSFDNQGVINVGSGDTMSITAATFDNSGTGSMSVTGGGVLNLGQAFGSTTWSSPAGKISETDATINLFSVVTLADLAAITRVRGTINFQGALNGGGGVLNVGAGSSLGTMQDTGTITNTIVHDTGNGLLFFGPAGSSTAAGATLNGDTYQGTVNMSSALARLTIVNGITATGVGGSGPGLVNLTGPLALLFAQGNETFNNMTINIGNSVPFGSTLFQTDPTALGAVLTLGAGLAINQVGMNANIFGARNLGDMIVNNGNLMANFAGGHFVIAGGGFVNNAAMTIGNGDTMTVTTDTPFTNNGTMTDTGGIVDVTAPVDPASTGVFILTNSALLELAADTGAGNQMNFLGTGELAVDAVGQFGTNVGLATYTGPLLQNFGIGDQIDLKDLTFAGAVLDSYTPATGLLQIHSGTTKSTLLFQNSSLGTGSFHLGDDGSGRVLVTHS